MSVRRWSVGVDMNISSVSAGVSATELISVKMMASIRALDMAQGVFDDVAAQLLKEMEAAITGLGQNVDMYV